MSRVVLVGVGVVMVLLALGFNTTENVAEACYVVPDEVEPWGERVATDPQWFWWPPGWGCRYTQSGTGVVHLEPRPLSSSALLAGGMMLTVAGVLPRRGRA